MGRILALHACNSYATDWSICFLGLGLIGVEVGTEGKGKGGVPSGWNPGYLSVE